MVRCDLSTAPIWAIRWTRSRIAAPDTTTRKREETPMLDQSEACGPGGSVRLGSRL